jgi:transcriptional regulator with XRE-family HTH domain
MFDNYCIHVTIENKLCKFDKEVPAMEVSERIFELVDTQFKEQREFASAIGVSASMVSAWRSGVSKSYMPRITQIAQILGTTVGYLLGEEDKPPTQEDWISATEYQLIAAYRQADERAKQMVSLALEPWKKTEASGEAM